MSAGLDMKIAVPRAWAVIGIDASRYSPALGRSRQPMTFMNVDLPDPEGPITATSSPRAISTLTPSSAGMRLSPTS